MVPRAAMTSDILQSLAFLRPCISQSDQYERLRLDAQSVRGGSPRRYDAIQWLGATVQRLLQPAFLIPTGICDAFRQLTPFLLDGRDDFVLPVHGHPQRQKFGVRRGAPGPARSMIHSFSKPPSRRWSALTFAARC